MQVIKRYENRQLKILLNFGSEFVGYECHAGTSWVHFKRKIKPSLSTEPWYLDRSMASCRITKTPKRNKMKFMCSKHEISPHIDCVSTFKTMTNIQIRVPSQWEQTKISFTGKCHETLVLLHNIVNFSLQRKLCSS